MCVYLCVVDAQREHFSFVGKDVIEALPLNDITLPINHLFWMVEILKCKLPLLGISRIDKEEGKKISRTITALVVWFAE